MNLCGWLAALAEGIGAQEHLTYFLPMPGIPALVAGWAVVFKGRHLPGVISAVLGTALYQLWTARVSAGLIRRCWHNW